MIERCKILTGIHGQTTDSGPYAKPPASSSFAQLPEVERGIAGDADGGGRTGMNLPDLAALQPYSDIARAIVVFARHHDAVGARAAAEDGLALWLEPDVVDLRADGYQVYGQAVAAEGGLGRQHARVDDAAHAGEQVCGDAGHVALDGIASAHALCGDDIALGVGPGGARQQGDVRGTVGVVLDSLDGTWAG